MKKDIHLKVSFTSTNVQEHTNVTHKKDKCNKKIQHYKRAYVRVTMKYFKNCLLEFFLNVARTVNFLESYSLFETRTCRDVFLRMYLYVERVVERH